MIDTTDPQVNRAVAHLLPGQEHHQFRQSRRWRREIRADLPARESVRRGAGGGLHRRRPVQAQAFTRERKLAVAQRSVDMLTDKYGIRAGRHHHRSAGISLRDRRRELHRRRGRNHRSNPPHQAADPVRQNRPRHLEHLVRIAAAAREVVNSVFLYYCTKAGLDLAIVNAEKLERFASIPEEERRLAEGLLFNTPPVDVPADHRTPRCSKPFRKTGVCNP